MKYSTKVLSVIAVAGAITTSALAIAQNNNTIQAAVTLDQASSLALSAVPGSIVEAELEDENGKIVWELEVVDAKNQTVEIVIDATSGVILSQDIDLDDNDNDDDGESQTDTK